MARRRLRFLGERSAIAFLPSFDRDYEETTPLSRREGGRQFTWLERQLLKFSFQFRRSSRADSAALSPDELIEQLANIVAGCIDRGALASFEATYGELIRYHRFLFDSQDTVDSDGQLYSFTQLGYQAAMEAPYRTWIRQYRRLFERAAAKLEIEPTFIKRLSYAPRDLLPEDARERSPLITASVLELAVQLPVMLENWFSRHSLAEPIPQAEPVEDRLPLAGSDEQAYRGVVYEFIAAWEGLLKMTPYIFHFAEARRNEASTLWASMTQSWSFYRTHLINTAYITGLAVWNQDKLGTDRYRDMLVKWLGSANIDIGEDYFIPHKWLLLPSDFLTDWAELKNRLMNVRGNEFLRDIEPNDLFNSILRHLYDDVLTITSAVFLSWRASAPQLKDICEEAAVAVHRRLHIEDGSAQRQRPQDATAHPFRIAMACVVRGELGHHDDYAGFLDYLVLSMNGIVETTKIPGRIYSGFGWGDQSSLDLQMLAILIASLPEKGDGGFLTDMEDACSRPGLIGKGDAALRSIVLAFQRLLGWLRDLKLLDAIGESVELLKPGAALEDGVKRLDQILADTVTLIEKQRTEKLAAAPIDAGTLKSLRGQMAQVLASVPAVLPWSKGARFLEEAAVRPSIKEVFISSLDKGNLTDPPMVRASLNRFEAWGEMFLQSVIQKVMKGLFDRPREKVLLESEAAFWNLVYRRRDEIGAHPVLLVPTSIANKAMEWAEGFEEKPEFVRTAFRDPDHTAGHGMGYMATLDGMDIMAFGMPEGLIIMFSAETLKAISAAPIDAIGHIVDIAYEDDGDPHKGRIVATTAIDFQWDDSPIFEIQIEN